MEERPDKPTHRVFSAANLFGVLALAGLALGVAGVGDDYSGFVLAVGAICYCMAYIARAIEKAEATTGDFTEGIEQPRREGTKQIHHGGTETRILLRG